MRALLLGLCLLLPLPAAAQAPDLSLPAWDLCTGPGAVQMACFTQDEVRQLLRLQEHARYRLELSTLHTELLAAMQRLNTELEASRAAYDALRMLEEERSRTLLADLARAESRAERYRSRLERRRIWPWVALGLGLVAGGVVGYAAAH